MIDLHTHVLPRVDDGPDSLEEAVDTISSLASGGTEIVVATPHDMPGRFEAGIARITRAAELLRAALSETELQVELLLAQEITFRPGLLEQLENGELLTINGTSYILFEFSPFAVPPGAREFVFQARLKGYSPILAHPERNERLQFDMDLLREFVDGGTLVQLTASSLFGRLGDRAEESGRLILRNGLAHFIASDCHSFRFGQEDLSGAVEVASGIIGRDNALKLVEANPRAVIEDRPLAL